MVKADLAVGKVRRRPGMSFAKFAVDDAGDGSLVTMEHCQRKVDDSMKVWSWFPFISIPHISLLRSIGERRPPAVQELADNQKLLHIPFDTGLISSTIQCTTRGIGFSGKDTSILLLRDSTASRDHRYPVNGVPPLLFAKRRGSEGLWRTPPLI